MRFRPLRLLTAAAAVLALALPAAGLAVAHGTTVDRGVIQSLDRSQIVLAALDGSTASFDLFRDTRVRLNGERASLADIGPGMVAEITADRKGRAILIRAFGTPPAPVATTDRGVVISITRSSIGYVLPGGGTRTVAVDPSTRYLLLGRPAKRNVVRPGVVVAVTHVVDGPALVVNVLKRARV